MVDFKKVLKDSQLRNISCAFTGHRPSKLYGYNLNNRAYQVLAKNIYNIAKKLILEKDVRRFFTGCALGFDTVAFFAIEQLKKDYPELNVQNILACPYASLGSNWVSQVDIERLERMKKLADEIVYVDEKNGYKCSKVEIGEYHKDKLNIRNHYMVDKAKHLIAGSNGLPSGTENCINYAEEKYSEIYRVQI